MRVSVQPVSVESGRRTSTYLTFKSEQVRGGKQQRERFYGSLP